MGREYFTREIDNECVIVAKLFRAPITNYYQKLIDLKKEGKLEYEIKFNLEFYLRFYFPKQQMTTINSKSERLIIMFNGLNEVEEVNFSLYDRLGRSFASQGIPAVLFPTPFHLNRAAIKASQDIVNMTERPSKYPKKLIKKPTDPLEKRPYSLYMNFIQTIYEYKIFRHLLDHEFNQIRDPKSYRIGKSPKEEKYFYNQYFKNRKIEINLLGYSLGGHMALACFGSDPEGTKSCALLNSGAALDEMNLKKFVKEDVWKNIVGNLKSVSGWGCDEATSSEIIRNPNYEIVRKVFFETPFDEEIDKVGKKLLFIMGGKDKILSPDSIKRLETNDYVLTKFVIGELEHLLFDDVEFNHWYARLINILTDFYNEPTEIALSKREAFNCLLSLHAICDCSLFPNEVDANIEILPLRTKLKNEIAKIIENEESAREILTLFDNIYRIMTSYTLEENYVVKRINAKSKELRFGKFVLDFCKGHKGRKEFEKLEEALTTYKKKQTKIGNWLVKEQYINNEERIGALEKQLQEYRRFSEVSKIGKTRILPIIDAKIEQQYFQE